MQPVVWLDKVKVYLENVEGHRIFDKLMKIGMQTLIMEEIETVRLFF